MTKPISKLMQSLLGTDLRSYTHTTWHPLVDIYRCRNGWLIKVDLVGVRIEDVKVSIKGRCVVLKGIRRDWAIQEGQQSYSMEIAYNRFERTIELPGEIGEAQLLTEYRDGMLLIRLEMENV